MNPARTQVSIQKSEVEGSRGLVATKHPEASAIGLDTLQAGGNAVDAAVAAAFAVGVAEPWSSGIGGGGYAVVAGPGSADVVAFPMQSPALATPDRYPLDGRGSLGAFLWPGVVDDANLIGWSSLSIPGAVAGLALLHERHGRLPWRELVAPAAELARRGSRLTWFDLLQMGRHAAAGRRRAELGRVYYADGGPPRADVGEEPLLLQPDLADSLDAIARDGPDALYRGDLAKAIVDDCVANGGALRRDDLAQYRAWAMEPLETAYRDATVITPGPGCAGPTTAGTLNVFEQAYGGGGNQADADRLHAYIWASRLAQGDRFQHMGDPDFVDAPWAELVGKAHAEAQAALIDTQRAPTPEGPGDPWAYMAADRELERLKGDSSTTHLCTADGDGTFVSLTNTLGGAWGAEIVPRGTGICWNDGMWWFDPRPGRPNSLRPRSFGLSNMTPAIVTRNGRPLLAVGASGGRRITNCVSQIISHVVDHKMGAQEAVYAPRIDASTPWVTADARLGDAVIENLRARGWDVQVPPYPEQSAFASPVTILAGPGGSLRGGVDTFHSAEARAW
ncbi:MAG: gamma-glutamyltransferase [Chloroflexota bacterium]|nr:gamma-glutamyltransferase [Chloroflexota bacterium]